MYHVQLKLKKGSFPITSVVLMLGAYLGCNETGALKRNEQCSDLLRTTAGGGLFPDGC